MLGLCATVVKHSPECWICSVALKDAAIKIMIVIMMDGSNHISERLASIRQTISDVKIINARYWAKSPHTALDKSAHAFREGKLLGIKQELADMMKRCA